MSTETVSRNNKQEVADMSDRRPEARWPAWLAIIATLVINLSLKPELTFGGSPWLTASVEALLLIPLIVFVPQEHGVWPTWRRVVSLALIAFINLANIASLVLFVRSLLQINSVDAGELIIEAAKIWTTNVLIFALWYWEIDRGGPGGRAKHKHKQRYPDFLFPQMDTPEAAPPQWMPTFIDYLYLSFTNSTAFSPTDTLPLTPPVKILMSVQSMVSLTTLALVAARAVNILPSGK